MRPFAYVRPDTLDDVLAMLSADAADACLLAGGTDLVVRLRRGQMRPKVVIDLKHVAALGPTIEEIDGRLRVGARVVMTDLIRDARVQRHFPALVEAASVVGSVQIRNRATLVGNVCNASPAADTAPPLLVYDAVVNMVSLRGDRSVAVAEFFTGPGRTVLARGEIVRSIDIPLPSAPTGAAFGRVTRRHGVDLATINLCCLVSASGPVRFAYGAVAPRPFLVEDDSGILADTTSTQAAISEIVQRLIAHARPISDVRGARDYRLAMLDVMSHRTLRTAAARLRGGEQ